MEKIATIKTNLLAAAHACTDPKNATRPIVQAVHLIPARAGDCVNVYGTQGHYMYIGRQDQAPDNLTEPLSIHITARLSAKFKKSATVEVIDLGGGKLLLNADNGETVTAETVESRPGQMEALERVASDAISHYKTTPEKAAQYAPASIKTIAEAIKAHTGRREATPHIHQRGERAALVEFGADDAFIIVMPYRTKPKGCPAASAWLESDQPKADEARAA